MITLLKILVTVRPSCFALSKTWQKVRCSNVLSSAADEDIEEDDEDDEDIEQTEEGTGLT
jgi:hypothetical protein